jgi:hypothetical protein
MKGDVMRTRIVNIGSCSGRDILLSDKQRALSFYDMSEAYNFNGSVACSYSAPGKYAERLYNEMHNIIDRYPKMIRSQYNSIVKPTTALTMLQGHPMNSVFLLDPGYEIGNFFYDGLEMFDIRLSYSIFKDNFPDWLSDVVLKHWHKFDTNDVTIAMMRQHRLFDFISKVDAMNVHAIAVDNVFSDRIFVEDQNVVVQNMSLCASRVPFLTMTNDTQMVTMNIEYAKEVIGQFYRIMKRAINRTQNIKWFEIDNSICFADPKHYLGYHPVHLHHNCRRLLSDRLYEMVDKKNSELVVEQY